MQAPVPMAMIEGLGGPFANIGEAVFRDLLGAVEWVNERGGIQATAASGGSRLLRPSRYDSKGKNEEGLSALRSAIDDGAQLVVQGNSSASASALPDAVNTHSEPSAQAAALPTTCRMQRPT